MSWPSREVHVIQKHLRWTLILIFGITASVSIQVEALEQSRAKQDQREELVVQMREAERRARREENCRSLSELYEISGIPMGDDTWEDYCSGVDVSRPSVYGSSESD